MVHDYKVEYENVKLRQLEEGDLELLREWRNNPENTKYLRKISYITKEMQMEWYQRYLSDEDEMTFAIVESKELKRTVGSLSLYHFSDVDAEIGKILIGDADAHGRHLGSNAIKAVLLVAFQQLELQKVYLHVYASNKAAVHSYKGAGMQVISMNTTEAGTEYIMSIGKNAFLSAQEVEYAQYE